MPVNQSLHDAAVRHQIFLQRYGGSTANASIKILDEAQRDLEERLRKRLARLGPLDRQQFGRGLATTKRMQALLDEVKLQNRDLRVALGKQLRGDLKDLADLEVDIASRRLTEAMGVDLNNLRPSPEVLRSLSQMSTSRLRGRTLGQWFKKFESDRFTRVESAVRLGMVEGDTITQIARRIRQAGETSKIAANALARTSVNHVANSAREAFYEANSDIIKDVRWTATLDGRTSAICQARDGLTWPVDEPHPRPPAHPNCRSVLTPVTKSWEELTGGEARLDPKRMKGPGFEKAMRKDLAERGMTQGQIDDFIAAQKRQLTGKVARTDTYQNWLTDQSKQFQDSVLGPTRGKLFREGNLSLDKFVDMRSGKPFNLDQLKKMEAKAWAKADLGRLGPAPTIKASEFNAASHGAKFDDPNITAEKVMAEFDKPTATTIAGFERGLAAGKSTAKIHRNARGVWSQERKKLHKKILRKLLTEDDALTRALPAVGESPTFVTFGGRGGSGKSWFTKKGAVIDKNKFFVIDNDEIKKLIPEFKGWNAGQIHEEASSIFELMTRFARRKGLNIVHDSTLRSTGTAVKRISGFRTHGYKTEGYYMFLPRQDAAVRAVKRAVGETKRYVPTNIVLENTTNEATFDALRASFDRWQFYDNQVPFGVDPTLIASSF